jgi:chemotaxis protein CheX
MAAEATATSVQPAALVGMVAEVIGGMVGAECATSLSPVATSASSGYTACVSFTGAWEGTVMVHCADEMATAMTASLFGMEVDDVAPDEVGDAVGELANILAGNIKRLLPEPTILSVPSVAHGTNYHITVPGAVVDCVTDSVTEAGAVTVSIWRMR